MPELPEVEVLVRHLAPKLTGQRIRGVEIRRPKVILPTTEKDLLAALLGARFLGVNRRGKYLVFNIKRADRRGEVTVVGHLGMTGRMYLLPAREPLPKHAALALDLGRLRFVYEDFRYFGRFTLDTRSLGALGPEPLSDDFTPALFAGRLSRSAQPIKVKLLDQALVAGVGNIYASEALHRAGISPRRPAKRLKASEIDRLHQAIVEVLREAIEWGSTVPLNWSGKGNHDGLFYYGTEAGAGEYYHERLAVYDRAGQPCLRCGTEIRRVTQAARSTYFCPACQPARPTRRQ
jgi:formamidopyrimidine-DNA glycosylase